MEKKKILIVAHHLTVGGVQKSLISALNSIDYEKNSVTVYIRKNRTDLLKYLSPRSDVIINTDTTHYYKKPFAVILQLMTKLSHLLRKDDSVSDYSKKLEDYIKSKRMEYEKKRFFSSNSFDIAIAYVQGYTAEFVEECVTASKKIVFYQGSVDELHALHDVILPKFDCIAVEHENIKSSLCEWYPQLKQKQFAIIDNYVDRDFLISQGKEKTIEKTSDVTTICSCGRFAYIKGHDLAVEAAAKLKSKGYKFMWYMVGDGPEKPHIEQMISALGLDDCVTLAGMQKNPYPYIINSDIFVQPSREEALSISMLESKVLAVPMVSTKTVGGCSMIRDGENGVLTEIDSTDIAYGIERLIADAELRERIRATLQSEIDYEKEKRRYMNDWAELLGD